ncbi:hypothetical protein H4Q26_016398 [Puccinia striiformis f. sp. tritici PST-130]|nr:hypothetical protein H4Q26_016398 [Puccinia striiformis f. sp. tritici PST-130]
MASRAGRQSRIAPKTALLGATRAFRKEIAEFINEFEELRTGEEPVHLEGLEELRGNYCHC